MEQFYKIAGLTVKMDTFGRTEKQAAPYLIPPQPKADIVIFSDTPAVAAKNPGMSDSHVEYLASGASFYEQLPAHGGMLLHSSAVVVDGKAYLFTAPRKTGKSTHVQYWLDEFGDRAAIINDDKPALRREDGIWYAYGTPWSGKAGKNLNIRVPVAGIAVMDRDDTTHIAPMEGKEVLMFLMGQTVRPTNPVEMGTLLEMLDSLLTQVPVWKLYCNMEQSEARIAFESMSADKENTL